MCIYRICGNVVGRANLDSVSFVLCGEVCISTWLFLIVLQQ